MIERVGVIEQVVRKMLLEKRCSLEIANWLEVELDEMFPQDDEVQDFITDLAMYRPQGGEFLHNEEEILSKCRNFLKYIESLK